jgi:hypothetical protein
MIRMTLEKALEVSKGITALNGLVVVANEVAPMVLSSGLFSNKKSQEEAQIKLNKAGLLVVKGSIVAPVKAGDRVSVLPGAEPMISRVVTTEELLDDIPKEDKQAFREKTGKFKGMREDDLSKYYKKYLILTFHPLNFGAILS